MSLKKIYSNLRYKGMTPEEKEEAYLIDCILVCEKHRITEVNQFFSKQKTKDQQEGILILYGLWELRHPDGQLIEIDTFDEEGNPIKKRITKKDAQKRILKYVRSGSGADASWIEKDFVTYANEILDIYKTAKAELNEEIKNGKPLQIKE